MNTIKILSGKIKTKKGGCTGTELWSAHRLEGVVKNKAIKPFKKPKKNKSVEHPLDKAHNPNKITKKKELVPDAYY
ncbi:MAG: hypothetical protein WCO30_02495 [bacterium]